MFKNILLSMTLMLAANTFINGQKIALVDVNLVLEEMSEYKDAKLQIDNLSAQWRQEISESMDEVKSMYNKYQAEQVLLSDEQRKVKEDAIVEKENYVREMQRRRFGPEGDLFLKRQELVAPIQDKVFIAIESYASEKGIDLILDKSGSTGLLFANPEYDKTMDIKKRLGIK
jgi:outer membrane protein